MPRSKSEIAEAARAAVADACREARIGLVVIAFDVAPTPGATLDFFCDTYTPAHAAFIVPSLLRAIAQDRESEAGVMVRGKGPAS